MSDNKPQEPQWPDPQSHTLPMPTSQGANALVPLDPHFKAALAHAPDAAQAAPAAISQAILKAARQSVERSASLPAAAQTAPTQTFESKTPAQLKGSPKPPSANPVLRWWQDLGRSNSPWALGGAAAAALATVVLWVGKDELLQEQRPNDAGAVRVQVATQATVQPEGATAAAPATAPGPAATAAPAPAPAPAPALATRVSNAGAAAVGEPAATTQAAAGPPRQSSRAARTVADERPASRAPATAEAAPAAQLPPLPPPAVTEASAGNPGLVATLPAPTPAAAPVVAAAPAMAAAPLAAPARRSAVVNNLAQTWAAQFQQDSLAADTPRWEFKVLGASNQTASLPARWLERLAQLAEQAEPVGGLARQVPPAADSGSDRAGVLSASPGVAQTRGGAAAQVSVEVFRAGALQGRLFFLQGDRLRLCSASGACQEAQLLDTTASQLRQQLGL